MTIHENYTNVFTYAAGVEKWCKDCYAEGGHSLEYTFCNDFAIADWYSEKAVRETFERVKEQWLDNYLAWTAVVCSLNMLSWCNHTLDRMGFEGRSKFVQLYSELYHEASNEFYNKYEDNKEACDYFFRMTD